MNNLHSELRKIRRMNQRGLVRRAKYGDKTRYLQMQVEGGQALDNLEHFEPFGFTSHPLPGAEGIVLAFNGNGSHSVVFCVGDSRFKFQVKEGEVAIYNVHGDKVHIKEDRTILVKALKVMLDADECESSCSIKAPDFINQDGLSFNDHGHTGDNGGDTSKAKKL